jgi:hypothetical protein
LNVKAGDKAKATAKSGKRFRPPHGPETRVQGGSQTGCSPAGGRRQGDACQRLAGQGPIRQGGVRKGRGRQAGAFGRQGSEQRSGKARAGAGCCCEG